MSDVEDATIEMAERADIDALGDLSEADPEDSMLGVGLLRPPRNTSKAPLPKVCELRRNALGRTDLFMKDTNYSDVRCSSSITQHVQRTSLFHPHKQNGGGAEHYTKRTTIACWHCCHSFDTPPVPAVRDYDAAEGVFVVYGMFCSLSCAKGFLQENHTFNSGYQMMLLGKMAREVYGASEVAAAPPRLSLDVFGGPYPIEKFRSMSNACTMHRPPFVSSYMCVEERQVAFDAAAVGVDTGGSVRGLRRPATVNETPRSRAADDCMFNRFLAAKGEGGASSSRTAAAPKSTARTSTLASFMKI